MGLWPQDHTDTSSGQNPEPWLLLCSRGSTLLFSPAAVDTQCQLSQKEGAVLTACGGLVGRDGEGDTCLGQGQAPPRLAGHAHRPERVFLCNGEATLAQAPASDLKTETTSKNLAAIPQAQLPLYREREEAPEQKATTFPPQLPPAWPQALVSGSLLVNAPRLRGFLFSVKFTLSSRLHLYP